MEEVPLEHSAYVTLKKKRNTFLGLTEIRYSKWREWWGETIICLGSCDQLSTIGTHLRWCTEKSRGTGAKSQKALFSPFPGPNWITWHMGIFHPTPAKAFSLVGFVSKGHRAKLEKDWTFETFWIVPKYPSNFNVDKANHSLVSYNWAPRGYRTVTRSDPCS